MSSVFQLRISCTVESILSTQSLLYMLPNCWYTKPVFEIASLHVCTLFFVSIGTMATKLPLSREPEARWGSVIVSVKRTLLSIGGHLKSFRTTGRRLSPYVDLFIADLSKWIQQETTGHSPPGVYGATCTAIGSRAYYFGGITADGTYGNALHELETNASTWTALAFSGNPPMPKANSAMIAINNDLLGIIGGCGRPSGELSPRSRFVRSEKYSDRGWTNELHTCTLTGGRYHYDEGSQLYSAVIIHVHS